LQLEQPAYWSSQIKLRQKKLDQAQQELMSARLSEFVDTPSMQQMAVRKARAALEEAQAKLERTKTWARDYDRTVDPLARKLDSFRDFIENDLALADGLPRGDPKNTRRLQRNPASGRAKSSFRNHES
jgi:hypothetical protein